ncbi:MAG TPA: hypothetical protein VFA15_09410, partial [Nitrososphaera sp.]|nr:hypothetical protein [Nitrososphaera sp.]
MHNRRGVSEIFGALMLILVVVTVVGGIAYFLASTQKQEQDRQTFLTSVRNDQLQVTNTAVSPSDPSIAYQLVNTTVPLTPTLPDNSTKFYVSYINETSVELYAAPYNATDSTKAHTCVLEGTAPSS